MTVLLLGDSHLAYLFADHHDLVMRELGPSVSNLAFGGAVAADLAMQASGLDLASYDAVVVSVGTNDAFLGVDLGTFRATLSLFLVPDIPWVLVTSPGADESRPDGAHLSLLATPYIDESAAAAQGASVVLTRSLLEPLGSEAFVGDGVHLTRAAYDVLVPAIAAAVRRA